MFAVHQCALDDYGRFTRSFVGLACPRIAVAVDEALSDGLLWPDAWVRLNPSFQSAGTPDDLVAEGLLHPSCARILRAKVDRADFGPPITLQQHHVDAIRAALIDVRASAQAIAFDANPPGHRAPPLHGHDVPSSAKACDKTALNI